MPIARTTMMIEEEQQRLRYTIRLLITHPSLNAANISQKLGMVPKKAWTVGEARKTPLGTPLPGRYRDTRWSIWEEVRGKREFFESATYMLERLESVADFVRSITETGGTVVIILDLFGGENIGDQIGWQTLTRMAALKAELSVEVFPTMN